MGGGSLNSGLFDTGNRPGGGIIQITGSVADQFSVPGSTTSISVDVFNHSDPNARLVFEVTQEDGSPLPGWLSFDAQSLVVAGTPPIGMEGQEIRIVVTVRDTGGNEASASFSLRVGRDLAAEESAATAIGQQGGPAPTPDAAPADAAPPAEGEGQPTGQEPAQSEPSTNGGGTAADDGTAQVAPDARLGDDRRAESGPIPFSWQLGAVTKAGRIAESRALLDSLAAIDSPVMPLTAAKSGTPSTIAA